MASKVTYKQAVLITRLGNGDWAAAEELWGTLTTVPFNPEQPLETVVAELTRMIGELDIAGEAPKAKTTLTSEDVVDQVGKIWREILDITKSEDKPKRQPGTCSL